MIRVIPNNDIDRSRWDELVQKSPLANVYTFSWYLDSVCPDWKGAVLNDYEAIFPLPEKHRFGLTYLVQPVVSQQYSICSRRDLQKTEIELFKAEIARYKSVRLCLGQRLFGSESERRNSTLRLGQPYAELAKGFAENTKRNIRKAADSGLVCRQLENADSALQMFLALDEKKIYAPYKTQIGEIVMRAETETYVVLEGDDVYAIAFFVATETRLFYLFPASSAEGKHRSAMFLLIDFVIRKYADSGLILDFEGSEIPGVRRFYEGFGAEAEKYYFFRKSWIFNS